MAAVVQQCSESTCQQEAAYRTRSRPSWCDEHITEILRTGGLEPLEPFEGPKSWRLTRCLRCGCVAHYRLEYILDRNASGIATCQACEWRAWAADTRTRQGAYANTGVVSEDEARAHAGEHGFDYLGPLTSPSLPDDPHRYQCRTCLRISAARMGDVAFGCACLTHAKRSLVATRSSGPSVSRTRNLLRDSGLPACEWWDHERNSQQEWATATVKARREVFWRCPDCGAPFTARVSQMTGPLGVRSACSACASRRDAESRAQVEELRGKSVADVPELLAAWADKADPRGVQILERGNLSGLYRFRCANGHHPRIGPLRYLDSGCPHCRGNQTREVNVAAAEWEPAAFAMNSEIASQWHPTRNGSVDLKKVSPRSRRTFWWQDSSCGHEWQETPYKRDGGTRLRCPQCRTILDSLAFHLPEIAAEWSPANPVTAWHVRPSGSTRFIPEWVCATNSAHNWQAPLTSRSNGSGCPQCREHGKSAVELAHHAVAERLFDSAASGLSIATGGPNAGLPTDPANLIAPSSTHVSPSSRTKRWLVDIVAELASGVKVAIEYDGSYWHADKSDVDTEKSRALLAAGYLVARLREHPLPSLGISDPRYREWTVYSTAPDPEDVIARVRYWSGSHAGR